MDQQQAPRRDRYVSTAFAGTINGLRYLAAAEGIRLRAAVPKLVTTRKAAEAVHVTEARIRQWASRGVLTRYGRVNGVAYYDLADVHRAAARMRTESDRRAMVQRVLDEGPVTGSTDRDPV